MKLGNVPRLFYGALHGPCFLKFGIEYMDCQCDDNLPGCASMTNFAQMSSSCTGFAGV